MLGRVLTLPCVSVAACNGHAFGAGAQLLVAHDYRLMRAERGFFCMPEIDMGVYLHPGHDGAARGAAAGPDGPRGDRDRAGATAGTTRARPASSTRRCPRPSCCRARSRSRAGSPARRIPSMKRLKSDLYPHVLAALRERLTLGEGCRVGDLRIGVIGAGVMGGGIAQSYAVGGYPIVCTDIAEEALDDAAPQTPRADASASAARWRAASSTAADADAARGRITWTPEVRGCGRRLRSRDRVRARAPRPEDARVPRPRSRGARRRDPRRRTRRGLPIAAIAGATSPRRRAIGWHWASPAYVMKFAEIVVDRADRAPRSRAACARWRSAAARTRSW